MVSEVRLQRIADRIRQELSEILIYEVSDPRLTGVSITDVEVDRELAYANIFFSSLEGSERADEILQGLIHAKGWLRRELAQRVDLRTFPQLRFQYDPTFERAEKIEKLFAELRAEEGEEPSGEVEETQEADADEKNDDAVE